MLTVIVADDEKLTRLRLTRMIAETGEATVVAICAGGRDAVTQTLALQPQLLFLDVQMPDVDGFTVLNELGDRAPESVLVTGFDQYAVRALDVHGVDFLLKPFDKSRFRDVFDRAKARLAFRENGQDADGLRALLMDHASANRAPLDRVAVKVDGALQMVRTTDIDWWETQGNYLRIHASGASHSIRATAVTVEPQLDPHTFIRVHRRFIVNVERIAEIQPWFAGDAIVVLRNGDRLRLSRTHRDRLQTLVAERGMVIAGLRAAAPNGKAAARSET